MRIKILVNFNGNVQGQSVRFRVGETHEINDADATHFVRAHYAEIDNPTPAIKVVGKQAGKGKAVK